MKQLISTFVFIILCVLYASAQTKEAQKFRELDNNYVCDDFIIVLQDFFTSLSKMPNSMPYVIVYEGKRGKGRFTLPRKGEIKDRMRIMQRRMEAMSQKEVIFIYGGFLEKHKVEFWIVPEGAEPPQPQPTLKKIKYSKRKYRKGLIQEFCGEF